MKVPALSLVMALVATQAAALPLINEFAPNPPGGDPGTTSVELLGTPGASFTGVLVFLESDGANGSVQNTGADIEAVSGTFDADGLLVVTIPDNENPSYTVILADSFSGNTSSDLDADNDGSLDAAGIALFGTVFDAFNIPDSNTDVAAVSYASDVGGTDLAFIGDEPQLIFRDGNDSSIIYAIDDMAAPNSIFNAVTGEEVTFAELGLTAAPLDGFNTFGDVNPGAPIVPLPASALLVLTGLGFLAARGRRTQA
ncbi:MAG: VPLPA-CTERM sorting domain-containing protein [Pseudomonadota bacterium]